MHVVCVCAYGGYVHEFVSLCVCVCIYIYNAATQCLTSSRSISWAASIHICLCIDIVRDYVCMLISYVFAYMTRICQAWYPADWLVDFAHLHVLQPKLNLKGIHNTRAACHGLQYTPAHESVLFPCTHDYYAWRSFFRDTTNPKRHGMSLMASK